MLARWWHRHRPAGVRLAAVDGHVLTVMVQVCACRAWRETGHRCWHRAPLHRLTSEVTR